MAKRPRKTDEMGLKIHPRVRPHPQEYARAAYGNRARPLPLTTEAAALASFISKYQHGNDNWDSDTALIIDISDFEIYRTGGVEREFELVSLHHFDVRAKRLSITGIVSSGNLRFYTENLLIENYSISGYGDTDNPGTTIYIRSEYALKNKHLDIWYKLELPQKSYRPFHVAFMWIADLGRHVIDYLIAKSKPNAKLKHFKKKFISRIQKTWEGNSQFETWLAKYGSLDFRQAIHAYSDYLYRQAYNLPESEELLGHPFWGECLRGNKRVIKEQLQSIKSTVATPFVYDCFKKMYFAPCLKAVTPHARIQEANEDRKQSLGFATGSCRSDEPKIESRAQYPWTILLQAGDVVGVKSDTEGPWKTGDKEWLAYITRTEPCTNSTQRLFVIWLYRPADTTISSAYYPNRKELFISDHCNCEDAVLLSTDVVRKVTIDWKPKNYQSSRGDYIIQTKYVTDDNSFVTFKDADLQCACAKGGTSHPYTTGETLYLETQKRLEPVVFVSYNDDIKNARVRRLVRIKDLDVHLNDPHYNREPLNNELAWTDDIFEVITRRLERQCHIRHFTVDDIIANRLPAPYNLGGMGDFWVLSYRFTSNVNQGSTLERLSKPPSQLRQGSDPVTARIQPLKGLSIFSGGGNLDRGLEELGAVNFNTVVDISAEACHTQLVNARHPKKLNIYWGSVDDYQLALYQGYDGAPIARIGDVQFIAAGSPCPGFSTLQPNWKSHQSLRNASHITTLCSFLDVYRPEYAILENVVSVTNTRKGHEEDKVLSQLVACVVAMGYQVTQFIMDSWRQGSAQRRSRVFVSITAPGLEPIKQPQATHSHPDNTKSRCLGKLPCGRNFGSRDFDKTPFSYNTVAEATSDLPSIGSGIAQLCIPFPDHRVVYSMKYRDRALMKAIPVSPSGQGYVEAMAEGLIRHSIQKNKKEFGRAFRRIKPDGRFPTITTTVNAQDNRCGEILHWIEPRTISIQEARRAQGIPDHEIIIGSLLEQWRIIGNAVDRHVARALGIALRHVLDKNGGRNRNIEGCKIRSHKIKDYTPKERTMGDHKVKERTTEDPKCEISRPKSPKVLIPTLASRRVLSGFERTTVQTVIIERPIMTATQGFQKSHDLNSSSRSPAASIVSSVEASKAISPETDSSSAKESHEWDPGDARTLENRSVTSSLPRKRNSSEQRETQTTKRTRHSGLQAEFAPQRWDKIPERLIKKHGRKE